MPNTKILFRDDKRIYHIEDDRLTISYISIDDSNIPHLKDVEILYYYIDTKFDVKYPVYFEYNGRFITEYYSRYYRISNIPEYYTRDYTLTNLKLI